MESLFSFPVGLLHPLQHAGLSRRTPNSRPLVRKMVITSHKHLYQYQFDASLKTDNVRSLSTALDWQAPIAQNSERFCLHTFPSPRNWKPASPCISL
jgi:hypothetical protein